MPTLTFTLQFSNKKNKMLQDVKNLTCETYLFNFHQGKFM